MIAGCEVSRRPIVRRFVQNTVLPFPTFVTVGYEVFLVNMKPLFCQCFHDDIGVGDLLLCTADT